MALLESTIVPDTVKSSNLQEKWWKRLLGYFNIFSAYWTILWDFDWQRELRHKRLTHSYKFFVGSHLLKMDRYIMSNHILRNIYIYIGILSYSFLTIIVFLVLILLKVVLHMGPWIHRHQANKFSWQELERMFENSSANGPTLLLYHVTWRRKVHQSQSLKWYSLKYSSNGHYPEYHSKIMYRLGIATSGESAWARGKKLVG
jgi:hypothetical protein